MGRGRGRNSSACLGDLQETGAEDPPAGLGWCGPIVSANNYAVKVF